MIMRIDFDSEDTSSVLHFGMVVYLYYAVSYQHLLSYNWNFAKRRQKNIQLKVQSGCLAEKHDQILAAFS